MQKKLQLLKQTFHYKIAIESRDLKMHMLIIYVSFKMGGSSGD